jgi:hypothetical protein
MAEPACSCQSRPELRADGAVDGPEFHIFPKLRKETPLARAWSQRLLYFVKSKLDNKKLSFSLAYGADKGILPWP